MISGVSSHFVALDKCKITKRSKVKKYLQAPYSVSILSLTSEADGNLD